MTRPLVIIPAYNEERHIGDVVSGLHQHAGDFDIAVIDDGSGDATAASAGDAGAYVIRHPFNMGYGVALQTGYRLAVKQGRPLAVQIDGDGQHDPRDVVRMAEPILEGRADAVYGTRFHENSRYRMPLLRSLGSAWFASLVAASTGTRVRDPTTGLQALSAEVLRFYCTDVFPNDYPDADMIVLLNRNGLRVCEVPVTMHEGLPAESMHKGWVVPYYVYKMTLAVLMNRVRPRELVREAAERTRRGERNTP